MTFVIGILLLILGIAVTAVGMTAEKRNQALITFSLGILLVVVGTGLIESNLRPPRNSPSTIHHNIPEPDSAIADDPPFTNDFGRSPM